MRGVTNTRESDVQYHADFPLLLLSEPEQQLSMGKTATERRHEELEEIGLILRRAEVPCSGVICLQNIP